MEYVRGFLHEYDASIFTMPQFVSPDFPIFRVQIIPPAIDPLSPIHRLGKRAGAAPSQTEDQKLLQRWTVSTQSSSSLA